MKARKIELDTNLLWLILYILLNTLVVGFLWKNTYLAFILGVIFLILTLRLDFSGYRISKRALIVVSLIVAIQGPLLENIMISISDDRCWVYGDPFKPLKTSLFLFPGYGLMGASSVIVYSFWKHFLESNDFNKN